MNEIERAMSNTILPCPFCGGEADIEEIPGSPFTNEPYMWAVGCKDCNIGWYEETKEESIAAWNRRAQPENKPLTLDELKQMDGEPVWVMHQDGSGARWGIVQDTEYGLCAVVDDDTAYWFTDVCGTIAYRSKPKEEV